MHEIRRVMTLLLFCLSTMPAQALDLVDCQVAFDFYDWTPEGCVGVNPRVDPSARETPNAQSPSQYQKENHIFFVNGGVGLDPNALAQIDQLHRVFNSAVFRDACIAFIGHSDAIGSESANKRLALRRAEAVRDAIMAGMQDPDRVLVVASMGEAVPLKNFSATSPWQRRVEMRAKNCAPQGS